MTSAGAGAAADAGAGAAAVESAVTGASDAAGAGAFAAAVDSAVTGASAAAGTGAGAAAVDSAVTGASAAAGAGAAASPNTGAVAVSAAGGSGAAFRPKVSLGCVCHLEAFKPLELLQHCQDTLTCAIASTWRHDQALPKPCTNRRNAVSVSHVAFPGTASTIQGLPIDCCPHGQMSGLRHIGGLHRAFQAPQDSEAIEPEASLK